MKLSRGRVEMLAQAEASSSRPSSALSAYSAMSGAVSSGDDRSVGTFTTEGPGGAGRKGGGGHTSMDHGLEDAGTMNSVPLEALSAIQDEAAQRHRVISALESNMNVADRQAEKTVARTHASCKEANRHITEQRVKEEVLKDRVRTELSRRVVASRAQQRDLVLKLELSHVRARFDATRAVLTQDPPELLSSGSFSIGEPIWVGPMCSASSLLGSISKSGYLSIFVVTGSGTAAAAAAAVTAGIKDDGTEHGVVLADIELLISCPTTDDELLGACYLNQGTHGN